MGGQRAVEPYWVSRGDIDDEGSILQHISVDSTLRTLPNTPQ